jgi:hypothetical protein
MHSTRFLCAVSRSLSAISRFEIGIHIRLDTDEFKQSIISSDPNRRALNMGTSF